MAAILEKSYSNLSMEMMLQQIKQSPNWQECDQNIQKKMIENKYSYSITQGDDPYTFILHYFGQKNDLKTAVFNLDLSQKQWKHENSVAIQADHVKEIVDYILSHR